MNFGHVAEFGHALLGDLRFHTACAPTFPRRATSRARFRPKERTNLRKTCLSFDVNLRRSVRSRFAAKPRTIIDKTCHCLISCLLPSRHRVCHMLLGDLGFAAAYAPARPMPPQFHNLGSAPGNASSYTNHARHLASFRPVLSDLVSRRSRAPNFTRCAAV